MSFDRVQHLIRVPVTVGGERYRFLVDTGIGVTVVSSAIAARTDVRPIGETFTGRRMSGQALQIPLVRLPVVALGGYLVDTHVAGVADLGDANNPNGFAGILGPGFFEQQAVTTDPDTMSLTVEPRVNLQVDGHEVPLEVRRDSVSVDPFVQLVLPSGREICVEIDTGSNNLILDTRFMPDCGVEIGSPAVTTKTGTDQTGHRWTRHWATSAGSVHLAAAPQTAQLSPSVQFQNIIHDGLLGADYLDRYRTTFDVTGARLIMSRRREARLV